MNLRVQTVGPLWGLVAGRQYKCLVANCNQRNFSEKERFQRHWGRCHKNIELNDDTFKQCRGCRHLFAGATGLRLHHCKEPLVAEELLPVPEQPVDQEAVGQVVEQDNAEVAPIAMGDESRHRKLAGMFMEGLYSLHGTWQDNFYVAVNRLLEGMLDAEPGIVYNNTLAYMILPGLIQHYNRNMKIRGRPVDLLREIVQGANAAAIIISKADRALDIPIAVPEKTSQKGAVKILTAAAEAMGMRARIAAADRIARQLDQRLLSANPPQLLRQVLDVEQARAILSPLHPPVRCDRLDVLPDLGENLPAGLVVNADMVLRGIRLLRKDAAPGACGWTNHLLKFMAGHGDADATADFGERLAAVFNKIYAGNMPESTRWLWTRSRSVLLPKGDQLGLRPIGIGDAIYRLLMRVAYSCKYEQLSEHLLPHQLAVGVRGGCEIGARIAQLQFSRESNPDDDWRLAPAIINIDVKNCWNECSSRLAFERLRLWAPDLTRLFHWTHVDESDLVSSLGEVVGTRKVGFRQGCPASTANACLALFDTTERVLTALREEENKLKHDMGLLSRELPLGALLYYADDGNVLTTLGVAVQLAPRLADIYAVDHLSVVPNKSFILSKRAGEAVNAGMWPDGWGIATEGCKILGAPVGTDEYVSGFLNNKIAQIKPPYKAIERLSKRLGLQLTLFCHNVEPDYVFRVTEPHLSREAAHIHDTQIDRSLALIAGLDPDYPGLRDMRCLPVGNGGLGIYAHRGRREAGALISRARTSAFLEVHLPQLLVTTRREGVWPEIVIGESDQHPNIPGILTGEELEQMGNLSEPKGVEKIVKKLVMELDKEVVHSILERLTGEADQGKSKLAFFRSGMSKASGRWLRSFHGMEGGQNFFSDREIVNILRARLLVPLKDSNGVAPIDCPCCYNPLSADREGSKIGPSHALGCKSLRPTLDARHDKIRDLLADALKKHLPLRGVSVTVEESLTAEAGPAAAGRKMDVIVRADNGYIRYIDIAVVEPSGHAVLDFGSWDHDLRAAQHREREKRNIFRSFATRVDSNLFVPLVFESSGRPGECAKDFLMSSQLPGNVVRRLLEMVSVTIARFGGKLIADWKRGRGGG